MVIRAITGGIRPEKPEGAKWLGFSDELWRTVEQCWQENRNARPVVEEILSRLNEAKEFWDERFLTQPDSTHTDAPVFTPFFPDASHYVRSGA
jgi:hypothetical protein